MRSEIEDPRFSSALAIFGSDATEVDAEGKCYRLTFDERRVLGKYDVTLHDNTWKW
jgi:hypothetical protein